MAIETVAAGDWETWGRRKVTQQVRAKKPFIVGAPEGSAFVYQGKTNEFAVKGEGHGFNFEYRHKYTNNSMTPLLHLAATTLSHNYLAEDGELVFAQLTHGTTQLIVLLGTSLLSSVEVRPLPPARQLTSSRFFVDMLQRSL